jgi:peroxiredoxin
MTQLSMRRSQRWSALALIALALGAGWTWASRVPGSYADAGQIASPRAGFPAPDFTLDSTDGARVSLAAQRGQVVIVNLWASWCGPCRAEMPALQQLHDANRARGLQVLEVNSTVQDDEASARAFARELGLRMPILLDRDGAVGQRYLLRALPTTFVVDRKGVIREVLLGGPLSAAVLQTKIDPLLDEAP